MAKRQPLTFDSDELTDHLKESAGRGMDAFFPQSLTPRTIESKLEQNKEAHAIENSPELADTASLLQEREKTEEIEDRPIDEPLEINTLANEENKLVNMKTSKHANKITSKQDYIERYLQEKAYITASFRLPPEIVEKFNEIYYLAKSKYKSDVKRYSVVVAALAIFLWDFETHGENSELYKLLIRKEK